MQRIPGKTNVLRIILLLMMGLCGKAAMAQAPTATLVGQVTDTSKAVVPGAKITVTNMDTNQSRAITTDASGEYTVTTLDPGFYKVKVEASGFQASTHERLELTADQTARLNVALAVGTNEVVVSVTQNVGLLNTETSTKGDVITPIEVQEMPLNTRDFNDLAFTVAGVQPAEQKAKGAAYVAGGSRADSSGVYVDGINDESPRDAGSQISPPLDSIQEFRMETSNYTAQYGRLSGSVVNLVIKTGANLFHGSMFDYVRNDLFDAKPYNFSGSAAPNKTKLRKNQFGFDLSGPLWIPKVYDGHDRTFFALSLEFQRQVQGTTSTSIVPTLAERSGDFSTSLTGNTPYYFHDPTKPISATQTCSATVATGCLYPTHKSQITTIDPVAQKLLAYIPLPNISPYVLGSANYSFTGDNAKNWNSGLIKVNHKIGSADEVAGLFDRYFSNSLSPTGGSALGKFGPDAINGILGADFGSATQNHQTLIGISETHIFTPHLVNALHFGRTRTISKEIANDAGTNYAQLLGIAGTATGPTSILGFPAFTLGKSVGAPGDNASDPITFVVNDYDGSDLATWNWRKHNFSFGGDILHVQLFQPTNSSKNGSISYATGMTLTTTADSLADLLAGYPSSSTVLSGGGTNHLLETNYAAFVQDDFKLTPKLTLNLGVRYELQTLPSEENGQLTNYVPSLGKIIYSNASTVPNIGAILATAGLTNFFASADSVGLPQALVNSNKSRWSPRLGFAYRPFADDRTVVRGGYGIFYTGIRLTVIRTNLAGQFPFSQPLNYSAVAPKAATAGSSFISPSNPFPVTGGTLGSALSPNGYDPNAPSAYLQSYNLTVERALPWGVGLEMSYVGSKGTHLGQETDYNQMRVAGSNASRPVPTFNNAITIMSFNGVSHYNSGQVTLRRRFQHGLFFRVNYTYARSTDSQSGANAAGGGGYFGNQNVLNPRAEYGLSDFDIRHNFTATAVYRTPSRFYVLRDWQLSGNILAYSGQPFTPTLSTGKQDQGTATRPDRTCNGNSSNRTVQHWFDTSCFSTTAAGQFGTSGRNILEGPGSVTLNLAVGRVFSLKSYGNLQFRLEGFNALNHPNWGYPTAAFGSTTTAGVISGTNGSMRQVQISGRYSF